MSTIKKIAIIFNRDVELSELTKDFTKLSKSGFFGLTGEHLEYYSKFFDKYVFIPKGFIKLNEKDYELLIHYYPENDNKAIRMASFETDLSNFHEDFAGPFAAADKSENVKKLIKLLKDGLSYYCMTLFTYDYWNDCPCTDELIAMQRDGMLNKFEGKCYLILDGGQCR